MENYSSNISDATSFVAECFGKNIALLWELHYPLGITLQCFQPSISFLTSFWLYPEKLLKSTIDLRQLKIWRAAQTETRYVWYEEK